MEAKELQLGDWVQSKAYNGEYLYTRIEVLDSRGKKKHIISSNRWIEEDEFEPIPLTPEILENNGWEHDRIFMEIRVDANTHFSWTDRYGAVLYQNNFYMCDCKDVHTLQHALRLCGLHELADNFKV